MLIRPAKSEDLPTIQKVLTESALDNQDLSSFTGICLVAEDGGEVIGFAQALPGEPIAYFSLLAVLPAYRHRSAAYRLVEGMELLLRAAGCVEYAAYVQADHEQWVKTMQKWDGMKTPATLGYLMRKELS